jgi:hypothetical protein
MAPFEGGAEVEQELGTHVAEISSPKLHDDDPLMVYPELHLGSHVFPWPS